MPLLGDLGKWSVNPKVSNKIHADTLWTNTTGFMQNVTHFFMHFTDKFIESSSFVKMGFEVCKNKKNLP